MAVEMGSVKVALIRVVKKARNEFRVMLSGQSGKPFWSKWASTTMITNPGMLETAPRTDYELVLADEA